MIAWNVVIEPEATIEHFDGEWTAHRVKARLSELLKDQWQDRWLKARRKKKAPPAPKCRSGRTVRYSESWKPIRRN